MSSIVRKPVRIGCYSGFWGDSVHAARQLVEQEKDQLDYLVADYLAEVTMGLLARRSRHSKVQSKARPGYIDEIIPLVLEDLLPQLVKYNIKLVCNAGGLDPVGLKTAIESLAERKGLSSSVKVAALFGDDIQASYPSLRKIDGAIKGFSPFGDTQGDRVEDSESATGDEFLSVNAYVGAEGIARALDEGATIVVTGRCVDSALTLGPCLHEHKWDLQRDLDHVAAASLAGHIIECGAQATGGNFTDWKDAAFSAHGGWANMGYGIVEVSSNGTFVVTKPVNTGGVVSRLSVGEQMLYEVLDPANYLLPDVILDLTAVTLTQLDPTHVLVRGAKGKPPTPYLKCTAISSAGWSILGQLGIVGIDAREKALVLGAALIERVEGIMVAKGLPRFDETRVEAIGSEAMFGKHSRMAASREVILRIQATHRNPLALKLLAMELAYSATSTSPAITGGGTGRPAPSPRFAATSFLLHKSHVTLTLLVGSSPPLLISHGVNHCHDFIAPIQSIHASASRYLTAVPSLPLPPRTTTIPLIKLAVGRSGDKGDTANIAFLARSPSAYALIREQLTEEVIRDVLGDLIEAGGDVQRYEVPGVHAVNFVVSKCLGGGGLSSLRFDKQAKSYAQICLSVIEIEVPLALLSKL